MVQRIIQVNFRMPADLKGKLEAAAERNGQSLTAEVVERLTESFNVQANIELIEVGKAFARERVRSEAFLDVINLLTGIIAQNSGGDPEVMRQLAETIRSLEKKPKSPSA